MSIDELLRKMKAKVLYTDGTKTVELFWINHTGSDVYCGGSRSNFKRSYHNSGQLHETAGGRRTHQSWVAPLKQLKGQFHLTTLAFSSSRRLPRSNATGSKLDAAIVIDSRSLPKKQTVNVIIGLLEPNNFRPIEGITKTISGVKQVLLATNSVPWVYAIVTVNAKIKWMNDC